MAGLGLAQRKVVSKKGTGFCYWYGRTKKGGKHSKEYDLTQRYSFRKAQWQMEKNYLDAGWREVDSSKAVIACRHSRMPLLKNPVRWQWQKWKRGLV